MALSAMRVDDEARDAVSAVEERQARLNAARAEAEAANRRGMALHAAVRLNSNRPALPHPHRVLADALIFERYLENGAQTSPDGLGAVPL